MRGWTQAGHEARTLGRDGGDVSDADVVLVAVPSEAVPDALLIEQFTALALGLSTTAHVLVRGRIRLSEDADVLRRQPELLAANYHLAGTS